jgi:hypothetical protein
MRHWFAGKSPNDAFVLDLENKATGQKRCRAAEGGQGSGRASGRGRGRGRKSAAALPAPAESEPGEADSEEEGDDASWVTDTSCPPSTPLPPLRAAVRTLEKLAHPPVQSAQRAFLRASAAAGSCLVLLDVPLLFETSAEARCDMVAVVSAASACSGSACSRAPTRPRVRRSARLFFCQRSSQIVSDACVPEGCLLWLTAWMCSPPACCEAGGCAGEAAAGRGAPDEGAGERSTWYIIDTMRPRVGMPCVGNAGPTLCRVDFPHSELLSLGCSQLSCCQLAQIGDLQTCSTLLGTVRGP